MANKRIIIMFEEKDTLEISPEGETVVTFHCYLAGDVNRLKDGKLKFEDMTPAEYWAMKIFEQTKEQIGADTVKRKKEIILAQSSGLGIVK